MIRVRFTAARGTIEALGAAGERLLDVAQAAGLPLEGTCNGDMACATCHVVLSAEAFARLPPASGDEEDLLDLSPVASRYSRLACQIRLDAALDPLDVRIPD